MSYDHVKLISAEVTDGATVWHSGNDGATSGLDADLLDGQHGSFYQNASNLNAGTVPLAQIPTNLTGKNADQLDGQEGSYYLAFANMTGTVSNAQLATDSVDQNKISAGAVHQGELDTSEGTEVGGSIGLFTLAGGQYSFYPQTRKTGSSDTGFANIFSQSSGAIVATYIQLSTVAGDDFMYAKSRYINSSPPHKIENIDYDVFIFFNITTGGGYVAEDPPWYHNGPTKVTPNVKSNDGKKYREDIFITDELRGIKELDPINYYKEICKLKPIKYEIDFSIKNKDISLLPHPFIGRPKSDNVVIIEPNHGGVYQDICNIYRTGESVLDLLRLGYLKIDNTEIPVNGKPPGVAMHRIKWKKT